VQVIRDQLLAKRQRWVLMTPKGERRGRQQTNTYGYR
jgi:hypothetical protein